VVATYLPVYGGNILVNTVTATTLTTGNITSNNETTGNITASGNIVAGGYVATSNGLEASGAYTGSFLHGIVLDYVSGNARISTGGSDGVLFYNNTLGGTLLGGFNSGGAFTAGNLITTNGVFYSNGVNLLSNLNSAVSNLQTNTSAIQSNIGSFYTWANINYGTNSYSNASVGAYLITYNGNILASNVSTGNLIHNTTGLYWANGAPYSSVTNTLAVSGANVSTSAATGALTVAGGAGIGGNLYVGQTAVLLGSLVSNNVSLIVNNMAENATLVASGASSTLQLYVMTQSILYYTQSATANFILNVTGGPSTTLNSIMSVGQSISVVFMNTNGSTPYYMTNLYIDGSPVTPKYNGGTAPSSGNANAVDIYTFSIIKTANTVFSIFGGQNKFA
jgi:hypothetical protein